MALNAFASPQKVDPTHVCGVTVSHGSLPAKVYLKRPNAHLQQRHQDLVIRYNALVQAAARKERQLPPPGLAPPGPRISPDDRKARKASASKRSNSCSSCDSSTKASTRSRSHSVSAISSDNDGQDESTSITLRNIPTAFTRAILVQLLDKHGLKGEYNMVYLPMDRFRKKAKGFAFVKFETHEGARRCMSIFEGFQDWGSSSTKVCAVEWGEQQGDLQSQVLAYGNGVILRADVPEEFKPALFRSGVQVSYSASLF
jgi:hypothetical protein